MVNLSKIKNLDKENIIFFLMIITKDILKKAKDVDTVLWILIMEIIMKVIGRQEWNMGKEFIHGVMGLDIKEISG